MTTADIYLVIKKVGNSTREALAKSMARSNPANTGLMVRNRQNTDF